MKTKKQIQRKIQELNNRNITDYHAFCVLVGELLALEWILGIKPTRIKYATQRKGASK